MRLAPWILLLLWLPTVAAQSGGVVDSFVGPSALIVDPRIEQTVTVHAEGTIDCKPLMPPPADVSLSPNPSASRGTVAGHQETYFSFDPPVLNTTWVADPSSPGRYSVDADWTVTVVSDAYRPLPGEAEISWIGFGGNPNQGADECDPAGYIWVARGVQNLTLTLLSGPPLTHTSTGTGGSEATPFPTLLPLGLVVVATALRRRG